MGQNSAIIENYYKIELLTLGQRPFIKCLIKFDQTYVSMNGKDHPVTSYISLCPPRTNFVDYSYIFNFWTTKWLTFYSFPNLAISKKTGPQSKRNAHGPSLHIRFLSKCDFLYCIYNHVRFFGKNTFWDYCYIFIILCISDSKTGDPILLFQNRTLISKL